MDSFRGFEDGDDDKGVEIDGDWDTEEHPLSERGFVNALLYESDESLAKDQDSGDRSYIGWEEAVQGWGKGPGFICLAHMHRRGKTPKTWDSLSHCLLCADAKVACLQASHGLIPSSEQCSHPHEKPSKKAYTVRGESVKTCPSTTCSDLVPYRHCVENPPKPNMLTTNLLNFGGLTINKKKTSCSDPSQIKVEEGVIVKDSYNVSLINCFAVLPPLRGSSDGNVSSSDPLTEHNNTLATDTEEVIEISPKDAPESGGSGSPDDSEGTEVESRPASSSSEDESLTADSETWTACLNGHRLPTRLSVPIIKRSSFNRVDDTLSRVAYRLGKYSRAEELARLARRNSGKLCLGHSISRTAPRTKPQLPMLLGTRLPIPSSSHRLLAQQHPVVMGRTTY